ncbi:MAG: hypothetical protein AB1555_17030 [Nitrospirota bacterium]
MSLQKRLLFTPVVIGIGFLQLPRHKAFQAPVSAVADLALTVVLAISEDSIFLVESVGLASDVLLPG